MIIENKNYNTIFKIWLLTSIILVFIMIIVGGLTRLTGSGLSITEWEMFVGIMPPTSQNQWNEYFSLYKKIPQFNLINTNMTLNDFKIIFYWEYIHRLLGRIIGLFFLIPLIFFIYKKVIVKKDIYNYVFIFLLICFQGFIGWFMVQSGLTENVSVSHYRLALHLSFAFLIISLIFWNFLNFIRNNKNSFFTYNKNKFVFYIIFIFLFAQIIMGAFVSGLDAGNIYQTWPLMNLSYFPDDVILKNFKDFFNFNDRSLVQFFHRNLAYIIFLLIVYLGFKLYLLNKPRLFKNYLIVLIFLLLQIFLGVITLISALNIYIASMHQITSLILFFSILNLYHNFID